MTPLAICVLAGVGTSTAGLAITQAVDVGPWWLVILGAMGGFVALIVKRVLDRQDARDAEQQELQKRREIREEKRDEAFAQEVLTLQAVSVDLRGLREQQERSDGQRLQAVREIKETLDQLPTCVVDEIEKRKGA